MLEDPQIFKNEFANFFYKISKKALMGAGKYQMKHNDKFW